MADARIAPLRPARWAVAPAMRLRIVVILGFVAAWQALGASGLVYPGVAPSWLAILAALARLVIFLEFWLGLSVTAFEILAALSIGAAAGIFIGIALGMGGYVGRGLERYAHYLASTPKIVFLPLIFILCGIGPASKIALGAFACSFPLILGVASAMRQIPTVYVSVARSFDLSRWQMARMLYLPVLFRPIVTGLRIALGIAFSACVVAEMKFSNVGLGSLIVGSYEHSRFAEVYAVLAVIVSCAITASAMLARLDRQLRFRTVKV